MQDPLYYNENFNLGGVTPLGGPPGDRFLALAPWETPWWGHTSQIKIFITIGGVLHIFVSVKNSQKFTVFEIQQ